MEAKQLEGKFSNKETRHQNADFRKDTVPRKWIPNLPCAKNDTWDSTGWLCFLLQRENVFCSGECAEIQRLRVIRICVDGYGLRKPNHFNLYEYKLLLPFSSKMCNQSPVTPAIFYIQLSESIHAVYLRETVSQVCVLWGVNTLWQAKGLFKWEICSSSPSNYTLKWHLTSWLVL